MAALTVRRRLIFSFLTILSLFAINQAINLWADWARSRALNEFNDALNRRIRIDAVHRELSDLHKEVTLLGEVRFEPGSAPDPASREHFRDRLSHIAAEARALSEEDTAGTREFVVVYGQLSDLWLKFYDYVGVEPAWAVAFLARADPPSQRLLGMIVPHMEVLGNEAAERARGRFESVTTHTRRLALLIFILSVTIGIVVAFNLSRYLVTRLHELGEGAILIGSDDLTHHIEEEPRDELGHLAEQFNDMATSLDWTRTRLRTANAELADVNQILSQRIEAELAKVRLAAVIQRNLLPKEAPAIPGYDLAGETVPAQTVGGDYYDFIPMERNQIAFCLGDVSGKGLPASLLMANLQAAVRSQVLAEASVTECLTRTNTLLYRSMEDGKFVTAFFCVLDHATHQLRFSNAGHNPPVLIRASGETQFLEVGGLILGFMENTGFEERACDIRRGDLLVIYSDGISESADAQGDEFGVEGIVDVIRRHRRSSAQEILGAIMRAATAFAGDQPQLDDMTMIVLKRG